MFDSFWGMYLVQSFLHSAVAVVLVDSALLAWGLHDPAVRQRFRFIVIFVPLCAFPLYHLVSPERADVPFRIRALLDSSRWLDSPVFGSSVTFGMLFLVLIGLTTLVFIMQELLPIVMHLLEQRRASRNGDAGIPAEESEEPEEQVIEKILEAVEPLPLQENDIEVIPDPDLFLYSSTGLFPKVFISTAMAEEFDLEQLRAAIAHEAAHIQRNRKPMLVLAYLLRMVMFFNPVVMVVFRKMAQEEEQVCDDTAVRMTGNPEALARAVEVFRMPEGERDSGGRAEGLRKMASSLEQHSHDLLLKSRITRIRMGLPLNSEPWKAPFVITFATTLLMSYFIL